MCLGFGGFLSVGLFFFPPMLSWGFSDFYKGQMRKTMINVSKLQSKRTVVDKPHITKYGKSSHNTRKMREEEYFPLQAVNFRRVRLATGG